jgi:tRNA A-37 threonylcarbamoyl transferase component Bud32/tetratricopeptide (TPR) repeat protein/TolB-like protein
MISTSDHARDADDWDRLERLFEEGLEVPTPAREAWLLAQCPDDPALRERVARMFRAHESPGWLDRPLAGVGHAQSRADVRARLDVALGERYAIEATLGEGGMATVFRAHERKHDRAVVLKVLHPAMTALVGEGRFRDEVRIAARLSHPNILALIDSGAVDGLFYYVMPYVGGESLREWLKREGALPLSAAITLLRDVADALAHAHGAGVVHRDLKPENVLVVEGHAFLIDFGVAKLDAEERAHETAPGLPIGTPGYMAPEQASGGAVDHRADLYAWGLLAREVLTGSRETRLPLGPARADAPRSLVTLIEACLAIDPSERPQSAKALVAALDALEESRRPARVWPIVALAATLAAMLGVAWAQRTPTVPAVGSIAGPIAVMPFTNETSDSTLTGWGRLAGDWVTQGLHESGLLPVVPWPSMAIVAVDHAKQGGDPVALVRRQTDASTVVTGSYYAAGDSLRYQASITDARTGRLIAAIPPVVVARDSSAVAVRELRDRVIGAVAVAFDERLTAGPGANPPTWEAYRLFDRGLTDFNAYRYESATALLEQAWRADTTFVPALIYAAIAAMNDGARLRSDSLLETVARFRPRLSAYHATYTDALVAARDGDFPLALAHTTKAMELASGTRASYNAANFLTSLNRPEEADAMLRSLDPDHGPMRDWPSYWNQRAHASHLLGRYDDELMAARELKRRFPKQRSALVIEARALAALGRRAELDSLLVAAETLDPDVYWSQGAMRQVAAEEFALHHSGDSNAMYRAAATWLESRLRDAPTNRSHREWLSQAKIGLGEYDRAERLLDALDRESPNRMFYRGQLATLAARRGNAPLAARRLGVADGRSRGEYLLYHARICALLGAHNDAIAKLSEGIATGVTNWQWMHHALQRDFVSLRDDSRYLRLIAPIAAPR